MHETVNSQTRPCLQVRNSGKAAQSTCNYYCMSDTSCLHHGDRLYAAGAFTEHLQLIISTCVITSVILNLNYLDFFFVLFLNTYVMYKKCSCSSCIFSAK